VNCGLWLVELVDCSDLIGWQSSQSSVIVRSSDKTLMLLIIWAKYCMLSDVKLNYLTDTDAAVARTVVCLHANHGDTSHSCCTQRLAILHAPHHAPKLGQFDLCFGSKSTGERWVVNRHFQASWGWQSMWCWFFIGSVICLWHQYEIYTFFSHNGLHH